MTLDLTVVILTYNEEIHIQRCIESVLHYARDIVIIDSHSNDDTVDIAKNLGARVYERSWKNYSDQFQWALDNTSISTEWVMRLDADEYLENPAKLEELPSLSTQISGIFVKRKYFFMGKWIKYGGMYPIYVLRLWRSGKGTIEDRWMDEHIVLSEGESIKLDIDIVDDNKNSVSWWLAKHNSYATREMIDIYNQKFHFIPKEKYISDSSSQAGRKRGIKENIYNKCPLFLRAFLFFIFRYFFQLGFLDGKRGFCFHFLQCLWYRMIVDLKVFEARNWLKNDDKSAEKLRLMFAEKTGLKI